MCILQISGFPDVLGCIDGTYISIRTPAHKVKSTYINRHDTSSITLQAICDNNKMFLDVFTGPPSKIHDARIYKLSFISKKLKDICENKWHILGDSAYPLKKWLLTPFKNYGNLSIAQRHYNYRFSATRVKIENSFGLLKSRWRQLIHTDFASVERTSNFILACCVLHNLCLLNNDLWIEDQQENEIDNAGEVVLMNEYEESEHEEKRQGEAKRNLICNILQ